MKVEDNDLYKRVIGCLMNDPTLMLSDINPLDKEDFSPQCPWARISFIAINNLVSSGINSKLSVEEVEEYINKYPKLKSRFGKEGRDFLQDSIDKGKVDDYPVYYEALKKLSLYADLINNGYQLGPYDFVHVRIDETNKEAKARQAYEKATKEEILDYVEKSLVELRARHTIGSITSATAGDGIEELIDSLAESPELGAELPGEKFNSIVRGALRGKFYLRSSLSNGGKSRSAVFDMCNIVYPIRCNPLNGRWEFYPDKVPQKALYIVTEQTVPEVQTMILAWLSGIEERKIKGPANKNLTPDEKQRVYYAGQIMKKYNEYVYIEEINDPDLTNVSSVIVKYIRTKEVGYVFYDYIFTSPALLKQFTSSGVREDVILGMLSNQLKEIAKTYNVFIMSATQLNGEGYKPGEKKDARMLRG